MSRPRSAEIAAIAVAETHLAVSKKLRWTFRRLDGADDYGLDALVEVGENRDMTGRMLALQIKGGHSYFDHPTPDGWWHYPSREHVAYWLNCSLPVLLVMYEPQTEMCHWQLVSKNTLVPTSGGNQKLLVPSAQVLDETALNSLRSIALNGVDLGVDYQAPQRALVVARHNQSNFRRALRRRYGLVCAVTGPCLAELLEAAHIIPFHLNRTHKVDEGVLLRSDVHTLFDLGLIAVDPDTWQVVVAPSLMDVPAYSSLAGRPFAEGPSREAIRRHFAEATADW